VIFRNERDLSSDREHLHGAIGPTTAAMPPRLPLTNVARCCTAPTAPISTAPPFISLFAALSVQTRSASILSSLSDNPGAYSKRIRKGRGPSSGYGKTAGRGTKGQNAHGKVKPWFQGGQTPLIFSHGRKGFENQSVPASSNPPSPSMRTSGYF